MLLHCGGLRLHIGILKNRSRHSKMPFVSVTGLNFHFSSAVREGAQHLDTILCICAYKIT